MRHRYQNAQRVLPQEVFEAVSEALDGKSCYLWVPAVRNLNRERRNAYILALTNQGHTAADIADRLLISERTVRRVLQKERKNQQQRGGNQCARGQSH